MVAAAIPPDEEERLRTLYEYEVLDTVEEESFDDVCRLAASTCETPIALITLLDRTRQWFKAHLGVDVRETERDRSFCAHAIVEQEDIMVVHDATKDRRFMDGPLVLTSPHVRFYAGVVLRAYNGQRLGTLCVIDKEARHLSPEQRGNLGALARQVEALLESRRLHHRFRKLLDQREQLARFVIHDLNNPLAALMLNSEALLWDETLAPTTRESVEQLNDQLRFVARLVKNFQDVAMSDAKVLRLRPRDLHVRNLVHSVVRRAHSLAQRSHVEITTSVSEELEGVRADPDLVERIIENLLHNALSFAPPGSEITVEVAPSEPGLWRVAVADRGPGVDEADRQRIFEHYVRVGEQLGRPRSRGLGLPFCRMAAEIHGGRIWVEPNEPHGSLFVVELPWSPQGKAQALVNA